jgi:hypothetical protein
MTAYLRNIQVNTVTDAATAIHDLLVAEGWTVTTGSPNSLPMVLAGKVVNSVRPYLRFSNPSGTVLRLNGDALGNGSSLSTNREWTLSSGSRLWMAADDEATCIYIKPSTGSGDAYHAGALERADPTDGWAWAVGWLTSWNNGSTYQIAQQLNSSTKWQEASTNHGIFANIFTGSAIASTTLNTNLLGVPILAPYFRFNSNDFRGIVKFAVSGLSGATAGTEYEQRDPQTGNLTKIYVCSGLGAFEVFSA